MESSLVKTTILTAPAGWGKTRNAQALCKELGCTSVVDNWVPGTPLTTGALHLTNTPPVEFRNHKPEWATLVLRGWD